MNTKTIMNNFIAKYSISHMPWTFPSVLRLCWDQEDSFNFDISTLILVIALKDPIAISLSCCHGFCGGSWDGPALLPSLLGSAGQVHGGWPAGLVLPREGHPRRAENQAVTVHGAQRWCSKGLQQGQDRDYSCRDRIFIILVVPERLCTLQG